jgi:hypothetical protein
MCHSKTTPQACEKLGFPRAHNLANTFNFYALKPNHNIKLNL